jgi:hypothetical protein
MFELRTELKKHGEFLDEYDGPVTFEILMKRLVEMLEEQRG